MSTAGILAVRWLDGAAKYRGSDCSITNGFLFITMFKNTFQTGFLSLLFSLGYVAALIRSPLSPFLVFFQHQATSVVGREMYVSQRFLTQSFFPDRNPGAEDGSVKVVADEEIHSNVIELSGMSWCLPFQLSHNSAFLLLLLTPNLCNLLLLILMHFGRV